MEDNLSKNNKKINQMPYPTRHQFKLHKLGNDSLCKGLVESSDSETDDQGNIKDLIDYSYDKKDKKDKKNKKNKRNKRNKFKGKIMSSDRMLVKKLIFTSLIKSLENKYDDRKKNTSSPSSVSSQSELNEDYDSETDSDDENYNPEKDNNDEEPWYSKKEEDYLDNLCDQKKLEVSLLEDELKDFNAQGTPLRFRVLYSNISLKNKASIIQKIDHYNELDNNDNEYHKLHTWINGLQKIPFDKTSNLPISLHDGPKKIDTYLNHVKNCLEESVYGHHEAKLQILQVVAKWISNPDSKGNIIGLCGPMGNGKTTLAKKGIAKAINKPFSLIALGGASDSSFLEGHDYTYEGSKCGRIVEILKESKIRDPVIFFDELDKVSESAKGQEIFNLLCHLTDSSQNDKFHDRYYSGIDFDLSKALMIFSFNDEKKINPILKDRITVIKMKGFKSFDKIKIANNYLLPELYREYNFQPEDIIFPEEVLNHIITSYTKEEGVRTFKKYLDTILSKINILRLTKYKMNTKNTEVIEDELVNEKTKNKEKVKKLTAKNKEKMRETSNEMNEKINTKKKLSKKKKKPSNEKVNEKVKKSKKDISDENNSIKRKIQMDIVKNKRETKLKSLEKIDFLKTLHTKIKNFSIPITITNKLVSNLVTKENIIPMSVRAMYL